MLIFDGFPTRKHAEDFAKEINTKFNRKCYIHDTIEDAQAADPFPFQLTPPIVHIERDYDNFAHETAIEVTVKQYKGTFAGT